MMKSEPRRAMSVRCAPYGDFDPFDAPGPDQATPAAVSLLTRRLTNMPHRAASGNISKP